MKNAILSLVSFFAWTLSVSCFGGDFWAGNWTGLRVCVGDPVHAIRGDSSCPPCNRLAADLAAYTSGLDWHVGVSEFNHGEPNDIAIVGAAPNRATPYIEVVENGATVRTIEGYRGDVEGEVIRFFPGTLRRVSTAKKTPKATRTVIASANCPCPNCPCPPGLCPNCPTRSTTVYGSPTIYRSPVVVRSSGPSWTWPGDLRSHLATTHGYSLPWLATLSSAELRSLHDNDHNSGRVTGSGVVRYAAPTAYPSRSYRSSGVQAFGMPLFGTYRASSSCPGGICP